MSVDKSTLSRAVSLAVNFFSLGVRRGCAIPQPDLDAPSMRESPGARQVRHGPGTPFAAPSSMQLYAILLLASGLLAPAAATASAARAPACVRAWGEARPRYPGYDHVVHLTNTCSVKASCTVSTNVNPQAIVATVPPRSTIELLTFMSSPAREFAIRVECTTPGSSGAPEH